MISLLLVRPGAGCDKSGTFAEPADMEPAPFPLPLQSIARLLLTGFWSLFFMSLLRQYRNKSVRSTPLSKKQLRLLSFA
jgi:hypothetical protein